MSPKEHPLFQPITKSDGQQITKITMRVYTLGEYKEVYEKELSEQLDALGSLITGLQPEDFEKLSTPDFNTVTDFILQQQNEPLDFFTGKKIDPAKPLLLLPIKADDGSDRSELELKTPTLKAVRMRDKIGGSDLEKAVWLTANCTGLGSSDMYKLSMPDWMHFQRRLGDFLLKPAAYFQSGTSSN